MSGPSVFQQSLELHLTKALPTRTEPTAIPPEEIYLRARLMAQEFFEVLEAMTGLDLSSVEWEVREDLKADGLAGSDLRKIALELADLAMTVAGTALHYGFHLDAVAVEVHRANLRKEAPGPGKLVKPDGWEPPDGDRALRRSAMAWKFAGTADEIEATIEEGLRLTGRRCASVTFAQEDPGGTLLERVADETEGSWERRRAALRAGETVPPPVVRDGDRLWPLHTPPDPLSPGCPDEG